LHAPDFLGVPVVPSVEDLKRDCSVIVANRMDDCLTDIVPRVYTCDLFGRD
jgi:UDPglucose 6-dehydrogenase